MSMDELKQKLIQELKRLHRERLRIKFIGYIKKTGRKARYVRVE